MTPDPIRPSPAVWLSILFLLGLQLMQLKITYDMAAALDMAWSESQKAGNAVSIASDARARTRDLERAVTELRAALHDLNATLEAISGRMDGLADPSELKKEDGVGL